MLEAEAEYVQQLHILVNNFLRPLRMAASSKKPPITHDDVSSVFLNRWLVVRLVGTGWCGSGHLEMLTCERKGQRFMSAVMSLFPQ